MSRIDELAHVVAPLVLLDAVRTSQRLAELGVPHALIGGLAVGMHGHPRATRDVDFLVGDEAFARTSPVIQYREELADIVRLGVIDLMGVPERHDELRNELAVPEPGDIPVIPLAPLVLLKLLAGRPQDLADVRAVLQTGEDLAKVRAYLGQHAPELVPILARLVG